MSELILASTSQYRKQLLQRLNIAFRTVNPLINESYTQDEPPAQIACRLAREKALAIAQQNPTSLVIGCDQVANLDNLALGKPGNHDNAVQQLKLMSGKTLVFHTAVSLIKLSNNIKLTSLVDVTVEFKRLSIQHIEQYLLIEQPYDCAGSAKCEGLGICLMQRITSDDPTALIGLPLIKTCQLLELAGFNILQQQINK